MIWRYTAPAVCESQDDGGEADRGNTQAEGSSVRSFATLGEPCLDPLAAQGCFQGVPIRLTHRVPVFHETERHVDPVRLHLLQVFLQRIFLAGSCANGLQPEERTHHQHQQGLAEETPGGNFSAVLKRFPEAFISTRGFL